MKKTTSPTKKRKSSVVKSTAKKRYPRATHLPDFVEARWIPEMNGWGVFALEPVKKGRLIERAPVLFLPEKEYQKVAETKLENYAYGWPRGAAIVFGYGSLYNHSFEPNAEVFYDEDNRCLVYEALRPIKKGEEIRVDYTGDGTVEGIWFKEQVGA